MALLCIETSSTLSSGIALFGASADEFLGEMLLPEGRSQGERLLPTVQDLLDQNHLQPKDLKAIAVSIGPGSFTGVRIGLATAQGLSLPFGTRIVGISSLEALSCNAPGIVATIVNAHKGDLYAAVFDNTGAAPKRLLAETCSKPEALRTHLDSLLKAHPSMVYLGDGVGLYDAELQAGDGHPKPVNLGRLAFAALAKPDDGKTVQPWYVRPESAEFRAWAG